MSNAEGAHLLVVDDDAEVVAYLADMLQAAGYRVDVETQPKRALQRALDGDYDLVVTDLEMPGLRGMELLAALRAQKPEQLLLLITAFGSVDLAARALREGACDFVTKPFPIEVLLHAIERALRERQMQQELLRLRQHSEPEHGGLVARSAAMERVVEMARRAAQTEVSVLLTGESGTGKGALARYLHEHSDRSAAPFLQVNCAALPASLVESELFGVRRGAFTDARADRDGLFVDAATGTLFLDEIAELPLEAQPKLLQALETGRVRPVGGGSEVAARPRVVAATNRPLQQELEARRFRPDLFYRLNVVHIELPPLRQRREDIPLFVDRFLQQANVRSGRSVRGVSRKAMRWLLEHDWPGNVRELANLIERAVVLSDHEVLQREDLPVAEPVRLQQRFIDDASAQHLSLDAMKLAYVRRTLDEVQGNRSEAARLLGIDRRTLYRYLDGA